VQSNTIGGTRTLTCNAVSATDADFRDITIAGSAAPVSGTRLGDGNGNSGITFVAGVNKYWNLPGVATSSNTGHLIITGVRVYPLVDAWYAGVNSTNNGSLGWSFETTPVEVSSTENMFMLFN